MSHLLHDALVEAARTRPDRDAVRSGERPLTFGEPDRWSRSMAAHVADVGIGPGDRIAVRVTNRVEVVVAVHAISRAGAAAVLLSPAWKERELGHAIELGREASGWLSTARAAPPRSSSRC